MLDQLKSKKIPPTQDKYKYTNQEIKVTVLSVIKADYEVFFLLNLNTQI